ncbi:carbohydrate binding domain-containing protein [Formosa algae]|uniref:hypothetical protein n=1 Tax=Formosa algae TaxID=225843 RepID=UPI00209BDDAB|nr:hypothetical protein [Formosa algae]
MKQILLILVTLVSFSCFSQNEKKFNLDFEVFNQRYLFPKDWIEWGDYPLAADTIIVHSGTYSGKIESKKKAHGFGSIAYKIPAHYKGKTITLEGYMKIRNVQNGYAGLLLRIDGNDNILVSDNMESQNINGTTDWKKYAITLAYPEHAKSIYVAGIMTGTGEAWFDDFVLTIDGQDVQTLTPIEIPIPPATLDKEFDLGSKLVFPEPNEALISNLEVLGKI